MSVRRSFILLFLLPVFLGISPAHSNAQESSPAHMPPGTAHVADTTAHVIPFPSIVDSMHQAFLSALRQMPLPPSPLMPDAVDSVTQQLQDMGQFVVRYISWELSVPNRVTVSPHPPSVLYDRFREFETWVQHQGCITSAVIQELPHSQSGASSLMALEPPELHLQVQFNVQGNATASRTVAISFNTETILQ